MSALSSARTMRGRRPVSPSAAGAFGACPDGSPGSHRSASSTKTRAAVAPGSSEAAVASGAVRAGMRTVKVVPSPSRLDTSTEPPCSSVRSFTSARPMPVPSWVRPCWFSMRWNRSNTRGRCSSGMPTPVSATTSSMSAPALASVSLTPPASVNLKALESRFSTIFSQIARSTATGASSGSMPTSRESPALSKAERKFEASSAVNAPRSVGSNRAVARPASAREKSSSVLTRRISRSPLRCTISRRGSPPCRMASSSGPSISVSGVRNSWLTLEKNAVLARSISARAATRLRSSSCALALATADAICAATRPTKSR